jgi:hypothetical protein
MPAPLSPEPRIRSIVASIMRLRLACDSPDTDAALSAICALMDSLTD